MELARQGITLGNDGMADAFGALAVLQLSMQADALFFGKIFLLHFQLSRQVEQSHLLFLFGDHLIEKREMVAEEQDGRGIVDFCLFPDKVLEKYRGHGSAIFMAETQGGPGT